MDLTQRTPRWDADHQRVLNAHAVPQRRRQRIVDEVPVRARVVWERDGEEWLDTVAYAEAGDLTLVLVSDARCWFRGVWLVPTDVRPVTRSR